MNDREQTPQEAGESRMKNSLPDEELMFLVRNGVVEMLGVLFDRYHSPLFNFYCKLTGDRGVSEDLVQDVFYRILKYRKSYQSGMPFKSWMYQIARNARLDHAKRQTPDVELEDASRSTRILTFSAADPVQRDVERKQEVELLHRALMKLPEEKREVLVLSRFQELKYEEIAQMFGVEVGAIKVRVHRALGELREIFQQLEAGQAPVRRNT
jgi:RNA polymerase sigma-70 factor, ECF subfamily